MQGVGISGRIAGAFIKSRLTPLVVLASLLLGVLAVSLTPREEEPQIVVPMVDVIAAYPGASAREVEERVTGPMERFLSEIEGVEYVYSVTRPGVSLVIVRFYVGRSVGDSLVKLHDKLTSNYDLIPPGVSKPIVKAHSIDDVPVAAFTLSSKTHSHYELGRMAEEAAVEFKKDEGVSGVTVIGGASRQIRVELQPERLKAYGLSAAAVAGAIEGANASLPSGSFQEAGREFRVEAGRFLESARDVGGVMVQTSAGRAVFLRDIARVTDEPAEPVNYVFMGYGAGVEGKFKGDTGVYNAVTVAVAKKKGLNAAAIAARALEKMESLRGYRIPRDIDVTVTRNYGESAKEKSDELLRHMMIATFSVIILIALTLGVRESLVVAVAVPVTLALTLLVNYLYGYTLNRVTLFALIFSIGILVDDAIVVVENVHRHFKEGGASVTRAVQAVDEVGNPTILATFAVIAALMPMAFVSGLMGPYMRPIPVGASAAMLFSLLIAFIVTPWLSYLALKNMKHGQGGAPGEAVKEEISGAAKESESEAAAKETVKAAREDDEGRLVRKFYETLMRPLIEKRACRLSALSAVALLLGAALILIPAKLVTVKMLPFDNKSELQVIVDMPEGSTLEETAAVTRLLAERVRGVPEVRDFQIYDGTAAPVNFNGLVRHYYMRNAPNMADIQINLVDKHLRKAQSHDIAKRIRGPLQAIARPYGANIKIAEIPPGPPVLSTLVAEVYGPDAEGRTKLASEIKKIFEAAEGVVDVDWMVEDDQDKYVFEVDSDRAARSGVSARAVAETLNMSLNGRAAGLLHLERAKTPVEIFLRMPIESRSGLNALMGVSVPSLGGGLIPLGELLKVRKTVEDKTIYHKNLMPVVYVTSDVAGRRESPVYAILNMKDKVGALKTPAGVSLKQYFSGRPASEKDYSMKWDGEWQITHDVFGDLGIAFGAVMIIIYVLVVGWFRSFLTPLIIMAPIPLTLVGILPGHWMMGAFFTATSMIGFIALAGIIVRNSILLVDFTEVEWRAGGDLKEAVLKAGAVRFRPIALTALAVIVGSLVMLFDPIFQGLAISMMFGAVSATALTLAAIPLLYYEFYRNRRCPVSVEVCGDLKRHTPRYKG